MILVPSPTILLQHQFNKYSARQRLPVGTTANPAQYNGLPVCNARRYSITSDMHLTANNAYFSREQFLLVNDEYI